MRTRKMLKAILLVLVVCWPGRALSQGLDTVTADSALRLRPKQFFPISAKFDIEIDVDNVTDAVFAERPGDVLYTVQVLMDATNPVKQISSAELCVFDPSFVCNDILHNTTLANETATGNEIQVNVTYSIRKFTLLISGDIDDQIPAWKRYKFETRVFLSSEFLQESKVEIAPMVAKYMDYVKLPSSFEHDGRINNLDVKPGNNFRVNMTIKPMPPTSEVPSFTLSLPEIQFRLPVGLDYDVNEFVLIVHNLDGTENVTSIELTSPRPTPQIFMKDLDLSVETTVLSIPVIATDELEISSTVNMEFDIKAFGYQEKFYVQRTFFGIDTYQLPFNLNSVQYNIPNPIHRYSPIEFLVPLQLGVSGQVMFGFDVSSDSVLGPDLPFDRMDMTHEVTQGGPINHSSRTKRAISLSRSSYFQLVPGSPTAYITVTVTVTPVNPTTAPITVTPTINIGTMAYALTAFTIPILPSVRLVATKDVVMVDPLQPQVVEFSVNVTHDPSSSGPAHDIRLEEMLMMFTEKPPPRTTGFGNQVSRNDTSMSFTSASHALVDKNSVAYQAYLDPNDIPDYPEGDLPFFTYLSYKESPVSTAPRVYTSTSACLRRLTIVQEEMYIEHGFTVLMAIVGLAVGAILGVIIVFCALKSKCGGSVSPEQDLKDVDDDILDSVVLNQYDVAKKLNVKSGDRRHKSDKSLVSVLALDMKMKQYRRLDTMDIEDTEDVDDDIEFENNHNRVRASTLLVDSLAKNGDIDENTRQRTTALFKKEVEENDQRLEHHYRKELDSILNSLVTKNKRQFGDLVGMQQIEKKKLKSTMKGLPPHEKDEMKKLLAEKHKMEQQELGHRLALEQDEQIESVRKDFAIKRRLGTKDLQNRYLNGVLEVGRLGPEQADWLLKQHHDQQSKLEELHDQEILNQRMLLEEKLARRKQLAQKVDSQEDDSNELLGSIEQHNMQLLEKARKLGVLDKDEVKVHAKALVDQMTQVKERFDKDRAEQERQLSARLTAKKQQLLARKRKEFESDIAQFEAKQRSDEVSGLVDPMQVVEARRQLLARQRAELVDTENEEDEAHALELMKLRGEITNNMKNELDLMTDELVKKLELEGMDRSAIDKILKQHRREMERLTQSQDEGRRLQEEAFNRSLAKNRKRWDERRELEKNEQAQLREHEEAVVRNIMTNQVAMSDEERDRVMRQYEQQMVKMENSLTLNKLRQRRKLEERLSQQKKEQMDKLEKRHGVEAKKMKRRHKEDMDDMEPNEIESEQLAMMKKHVNQKLSVLHGDKMKLTDELVQIETEMAEERAMDIKKQEEDLAAMMAQQQLEKAKEIAKIHEQQRAIEGLKNNLLDNLSNNDVISDPECEQIIAKHQKEKERLNKKQNAERSKQEQIIQERLAEKRRQMESQLAEKHEREMEKVLGSSKSKASAKFARAMLVNQHMMEREQFKNRLEKEIDQTLEDIRQQHALRKQEAAQELEMKFIAGLIRLGKVQKSEILQLLRNLCPLKSEAEIADMFQQIYDRQSPQHAADQQMRMRNAALV